MSFKCPSRRCRNTRFETLKQLGKHLEKNHGLSERKRQKVYVKMGYVEGSK